jgi:zinc transporter, ZIP family
MLEGNVLIAFLVTLAAGLSTGIGAAMAFFTRTTSKSFLSIALGFSAGVMIYVSFVEIFPKSYDALAKDNPENLAMWITTIAFFGGIMIILLIDKLIPSYENPHEPKLVEDIGEPPPKNDPKLMRMGLFTALAIAIHNFPEGIATFTAYMSDPFLGVSIAIAIGLHNIPEGIAVSVPIYHATKNRKKSFWLGFSSGLAEPVGAIIGFLILSTFLTDTVFGILFAAVAGIMVFISLDELLPTAKEYESGHNAIYGLVAGMGLMALSLLLFQ